MNRMMDAMTPHPSGSVDEDFVAMMVPHHQGAIEMAMAELRYGTNEQLRRIAQEIIVEQQQEIIAMHLALDQPLPKSAPAPTQPADPGVSKQTPTAPSGGSHAGKGSGATQGDGHPARAGYAKRSRQTVGRGAFHRKG
ncbi:hypothetical protein WQE_51165 [Paraburkholderia hospita]|uniref:DUF305 domain-containing protein n=2 Tax=Paraburkholderia hospita TaxID=169430 RepID=A0ABN0F3G3_9BURK|nr:hypothetical protein WQE_51165 [Paraburkholderia hospita]